MSKLLFVRRVPLLLCALASVGMGGISIARSASAAEAPPAEAPIKAHWITHEFNLTYMGFTTHYTCDGLQSDLREILLQLGARKKDLKVRQAGCSNFNGPSPMPGVRGSFSVLVPDEADTPASVRAQWRPLDLMRKLNYNSDLTGNCELLEQVRREILPMVSSRNVNIVTDCFPHQASVGGVSFKLDVLLPVEAPRGAAKGGSPDASANSAARKP